MARIIPKRVLEDIRFRNDIADVIGSYLTLKRAGGTFKALCPFHKEKTPSFTVNPQRQIFHCFGCGEGGDVFGFIMKQEGLDFMGAARFLARRAGMALELEEGDGAPASRKAALYKILEDVAAFYRRCLLQVKSAAPARAYLEQRGLAGDIAEEFLIGYAPNRWDSVLRWAQKHKVEHDALLEAGLVVPRDSSGRAEAGFYDRFRHRVMFPIRDEQSRVIGFSGRCIEKDAHAAKYVNSPETPLFRKSRVLYALDRARKPIVDAREALICEGQIDVIRCHQNGFKTAVASQGTAFTEEHARILKRYADSVVIVFDQDTAGQDAAVKAAGVFLDAGLAVRIATLPEGEDPDSFLCDRGADAFQALLDQAASAVDFQIRVLERREDAASEVGTMRIARGVLETVGRSANAVLRARMLQEAADRLKLPASALNDELERSLERQRRYARRAESAEEPAPGAPEIPEVTPRARPREELELCEYLARIEDAPAIGVLVRDYLPLELLADMACRTLAAACLEAWQTGREVPELLAQSEDESGALRALAVVVQDAPFKLRGEEYSYEDAVKGLVLRIWQREFRRRREALGPDDVEARFQLSYDLKALSTWDTGAPIIEMELAEREEQEGGDGGNPASGAE